MEQKKKSGLLPASSVVGFAYWIGIFGFCLYFFIQGIKSAEPIQVGFLEGLSNLVKDFEAVKWLLCSIGIIALFIAPPVLGLIAWKKDSKLLGGIAGALYILTFNFISAIMCIIGTRPRFLEGRKTLLFIAGYIGIVNLALLGILLLLAPMEGTSDDAFMLYFLISLLVAAALNGIGWYKNNGKVTLAAAIVYIVSVSGIPSAVLCFIGRAQLKKQGA
jgi:hypothetical protein